MPAQRAFYSQRRDTAQVTSQENVEVERAFVDAWNRNDLDAIMAAVDSDVEFVDSRRLGGGPHRGREAYRAQVSSILDAFIDLRGESEVLAAQDDVVVARARLTGHAEIGGGEMEAVYTAVLTFRDNRIVRNEIFDTPEEALEAVGLREEDLKPAE